MTSSVQAVGRLLANRPAAMSDKGEVTIMKPSAARLDLERSYKIMMKCQGEENQEGPDVRLRLLAAAMHVIVAWEAISEEVTAMALEAMDTKGLTQPR